MLIPYNAINHVNIINYNMRTIASDIIHSQDFIFIILFIFRLFQAALYLREDVSLQLSIALIYSEIYSIAFLYTQTLLLFNIHLETLKYPFLWLLKAFSAVKYDNLW